MLAWEGGEGEGWGWVWGLVPGRQQLGLELELGRGRDQLLV